MKNTPKPARSLRPANQSAGEAAFPIVGIGASAGGLEALGSFLEHIPSDSKLAFVIVQHLDPTHKGMMPELLQRMTSLKVVQVTDRLKVRTGYVYVIPPNRNMSLLNNTLYLFDRSDTRGANFPIDFFFRSLADDLMEKSIGIILSGMGTDGSLGLRAIKEKSGITLVQSPASARFDGMPKSALETVMVDIVAPPEELPVKLLNYLNSFTFSRPGPDINQTKYRTIEKITILLRTQTGNDFSLYKKTTLHRRIERRMEIHKIADPDTYLRYLQETPAELNILFKELLIGVTGFFRNPEIWETMKEKILPDMMMNMPSLYTIRAWIPACATGEEAYSLAMIFLETLKNTKPKKEISLQIFGTDINEESIEKARKGFFSPNIISEVSSDRLTDHFKKTESGYNISSRIREMIVFAPQNVIKDPPFTKIDILICRNLLIYLEPVLQKNLISVFHYALNPGGLLILGNEETVGSQSHLFGKLINKLRIYKRTDFESAREQVDFSFLVQGRNENVNKLKNSLKNTDNIQSLTVDLLLSKFTPPSVLVDNKGEILYIAGHTGKYLEPAAGKANMNIFAMVRESLQFEFPIAFRKAQSGYEKSIIHNISIESNGNKQIVDIIIQQIEKPAALKGLFLVVFSDVKVTSVRKPAGSKKRRTAGDARADELDDEVERLKDELKNTLEAMQASDENLKSANEELQSTNEELQSTNEELTTSREEMQSINEELQTVNIELMNKIEDYSKINNDLKNLLESTEIASLFLDKKLKVRRFTKKVEEIFRLLPGDVGRPFTDLTTDLIYNDLHDDCRKVLQNLLFIEREIRSNNGEWYKVRIMPYRTTDDVIDGLVITFSDITRAKKLEEELGRKIDKLRGDIQNSI